MITLWLLLGLLAALVFLGGKLGIYPHQPFVLLMAPPLFLSLWLIVLPEIWPAVAVVDAVVLLIVGWDLYSVLRPIRISVERRIGRIASLGKLHQATLIVSNQSKRTLQLWIRDGVDQLLAADPDEFSVSLAGRTRLSLRYEMRPRRRGAFAIEQTFFRLRSRWGFWRRYFDLPCPAQVNVYPDMKQLGEYALLARTNRLSLIGLRRTRKLGQDNEFERLRDYTLDDNFRHIDWRSTARRQKLTVRDFQANQSQRLVFLVDCGRMMTGESAGASLLDHALNAMLMLSYVALRANDQVGLICFSDEIHSFVPPKGGQGQMNRLLHAAYDRFPRMVESRYDDAFLQLAGHVRKRSLVVLITNVIDEVNAHQVHRHLLANSGRHLPLGVLLRDHSMFDPVSRLDEQLERDPQHGLAGVGDARLYQAAAAAEILSWRRHVLADLETHGVLAVDVFPEDLTTPLVNQYLEVKARHLL